MIRLALAATAWLLLSMPALAQECRDAAQRIAALLEEPVAGSGPARQPGEVAVGQPQYGSPEDRAQAAQAAPALKDEGEEAAEEQPQQGSARDLAAAAPTLRPGEVATEQPQYGSEREDAPAEAYADIRQRLAELRDRALALADQQGQGGEECAALVRRAEALAER